jgi:hypothetical protein
VISWHEINEQLVFVLPAETIATDLGEAVELDPKAIGPYETRGSLEDWKQGVGRLTAGHALPIFMVSAALAGPLAHLVGAEGGGVHVFGNSSIGKFNYAGRVTDARVAFFVEAVQLTSKERPAVLRPSTKRSPRDHRLRTLPQACP